MKSIIQIINEGAPKKPSDLKKFTDKSYKKTNTYIAGDIYDFTSRDEYTQEDTYYKGEGNGYIMDKEGQIYDVDASEGTEDAGRIVGGTHTWHCTIKNIHGKDTCSFYGYWGIMSNPSSDAASTIVSDIKAGYYLEDYFARHAKDISRSTREKFQDIIDKGDPNARSYEGQKADKKAAKIASFYDRYVPLSNNFSWTIEGGDVKINTYNIQKKGDIDSDNAKEIKKKAISIISPKIKECIAKEFNTSIDNLNGLSGYVCWEVGGKLRDDNSRDRFLNTNVAIDIKEQKIVFIHGGLNKGSWDWNNHKDYRKQEAVDTDVKPVIGLSVSARIKDATPFVEKLFKTAEKAWLKMRKSERKEAVEADAATLRSKYGVKWRMNPNGITKGESIRMAQATYDEATKNNTWGGSYASSYSYKFLSQFIESDEIVVPDNIDVKPEEVGLEPEKKARGKATKLSKGTKAAAEGKMDAWHNGERKQNVSNLSDEKLKLNYSICKDKGYEPEMKQLQDEAKKRNLTLESISLGEYVTAINESIYED